MKKKNPLKISGLVLLGLILLCALFIAGLHFYDQSSLKREAERIHQKGQLVEIDGKNMNIYMEGHGEKVLVFMAGANTPAVTYDFKPLYSQLSQEYRIAVIEKFGYGYSDDTDGDRSLGTMLRQDREALKKAGVEAAVDVYHTDFHAFDLLRDNEVSREAIANFNRHFEYALEHYAK